jgi:hypothetical protein
MSEKPKTSVIHSAVPPIHCPAVFPFIHVGDASEAVVEKLRIIMEERAREEDDGK